jgi:imidazolonepropionase-like amidohydrolase
MIGLGADVVKLFTGSYADRGRIVVMPGAVVRAAVEAAHRRNRIVLAHPSNSAGARVAVEGGVDVLAHTFPSEVDGPWDRTLPGTMREHNTGLIPTLKLWPYELGRLGLPPDIVQRVLATGEEQVLFGTDVGYMTDYDPTDEYVSPQQASLSYAQILTALTTAPAPRSGQAARTGRLAPGLDAALAVVDGDPTTDIRALAHVRYARRIGHAIFDRPRQ